MSKYYKITLIKPNPNKDGAEQYPWLSNKFRFIDLTKWFKASSKVETLPPPKLRSFIEKQLTVRPKGKLNQNYDYNKKEKVEMISEGENNPTIFRGKVKIPRHLRDEDFDQKQHSNFGDMR